MNTISLLIWAGAIALYLVFLAWHENWRGPLTETEIRHFMTLIEANEDMDNRQRQILADFMRTDTGREFFMVNLLAFPEGKVPHPDSGTEVTGPVLLQEYTRPFIGNLFRNAGYPAYIGFVKGNYLEAWEVADNPGWQVAGLIRYRSRRDMLRATTDPSFAGLHIYKRAALAVTLAMPAETNTGALLSPRLWVALALGTLAAFAQLFWLVFRI